MTRSTVLIAFATAMTVISVMADDAMAQFTGRVNQLDAMRALPGTFQIAIRGDYDVEVPETVQLRLDGLDDLYHQGRSAGNIPADVSLSQFKWIMVAGYPQKYLSASGRKPAKFEDEAELGYGTGFAISREGYVLTNRHVVTGDSLVPLLPDNLIKIKPKCLSQLSDDLITSIGAWNGSSNLGADITESILYWLGNQGTKKVRNRRPQVVVAYADPKTTLPGAVEMTSKLFGVATEQRIPISVPAKIIYLVPGEDHLNDVAILKIDADVLDALVCLPLAAAGQAMDSMSIFSLGFPGYRYNESMSLAERRMVNVNKGSIIWAPNPNDTSLARRVKAQTIGLESEGQKLMLVSAIIRPGSSGGPVVLEDGTAVGLNVAYVPNYTSIWNNSSAFGKNTKFLFPTNPEPNKQSLDIVVPIESALKMLAENQITPDIGPTTRLWREGMSLYESGRHAEALTKFEQVAAKQVMSRTIGKPYEAKKQPVRIVSHYVQEMIDLCRAAAAPPNK